MTLAATIINAAIGLAFFAYIPGFLIVKLFFDDEEGLEKLLLAIILSIMIAMTIGIFFGYDRAQAAATGGFTTRNMWIGELGVSSVLAIAVMVKHTLRRKTPKNAQKKRPKPKGL